MVVYLLWSSTRGRHVLSSSLVPLKTRHVEGLVRVKSVETSHTSMGEVWNFGERVSAQVVAAVAERYRYRIVACLVTSSSPVPVKTLRVGQRCMLNLSRAETSSRWRGVVVRRGGASSHCASPTV
ncbi:uncharacterized protein TNCV_4270191 [Trichonephila clavipes]|nr:uncharacterized protein TNCV_4270191 [Trichonephila clavipes]